MSRLVPWLALAASAIGLFVAASALLGGLLPLLFVFGNFAVYAALMCLAAAVFAWRLKVRTGALAALGAAIVNAAITIPAYIGPPGPAEGAQVKKLFLFNMHWSNERFDEIADLIRESDPDIVVLSEVHRRNREGLRAIDALYPYRLECWQSRPCDTLILSRLQLREQFVTGNWMETELGIARVEFDAGACPVTLFAVHFTRPWPFHSLGSNRAQFRQANALAAAVREWPGAKIVAGDMNATTWTPIVKALAEAASGQALAGVSGTWPSYLPGVLKMPIDHVIVSRPQISATRKVLAPTGSDHSPVLVTFSAECGR